MVRLRGEGLRGGAAAAAAGRGGDLLSEQNGTSGAAAFGPLCLAVCLCASVCLLLPYLLFIASAAREPGRSELASLPRI
jgi:hypothetical protein